MKNRDRNDQEMIRYLLGELSKQEQISFEERYLMDGDYFQQLLDVEDELIHKYVMNELSGYELERFEKHFLPIPQNREKVELAQALLAYITKEQSQEKKAGLRLHEMIFSLSHAFKGFLASKTSTLRWSFAIAMLFMIFVSSWLFTERFKLLQREQELRQQVDMQHEQNKALADKLQNEQNQRTELERKLQTQTTPKRDLFTVALRPGVQRNTRNANTFKRSQIGQGEQLVKLMLYLRNQETYDNYRAFLETAEGDTIWNQYQLAAQETKKGKTIALLLPSALLSYNDFLITVYGTLPSKEIEYVDSFYFNIAK